MKTRRRIVLCAVCVLGIVAASFLLFSTSPTDEEIGRALSTTILKRLETNGARPREVVEIILQAYREQHPEMPELRVVSHRRTYANGVKQSDPFSGTVTLTFDMRDIPADIALGYVQDLSYIGCSRRGNTLYFFHPTMTREVPPLTTWEIFKDDVGELWGRVREKVWGR